MEDLVEVGLPSRNRLLIVPRMKKSGDCITPALFDDLLLYSRDRPVIDRMADEKTGNGH